MTTRYEIDGFDLDSAGEDDDEDDEYEPIDFSRQ